MCQKDGRRFRAAKASPCGPCSRPRTMTALAMMLRCDFFLFFFVHLLTTAWAVVIHFFFDDAVHFFFSVSGMTQMPLVFFFCLACFWPLTGTARALGLKLLLRVMCVWCVVCVWCVGVMCVCGVCGVCGVYVYNRTQAQHRQAHA